MMRYVFYFFTLVLSTNCYSQEITQTIKGKILDSESLQPLPGATIVILGTEPLKGCTSNSEGMFYLENVPVGRQTIRVNFIGYEPVTIPDIMVGSAKEVYLEIKLTESTTSLDEVKVVASKKNKALNEMATLSSKSFSVEETKRYAASISDPGRMAQSYAGVTSGDDATNQIIIRGNSPNGLLWRMEGVEIPAPSHFAEEGYAAGFVSILNANMLSTSDFYTGAFPAEFNNAYSGVFDIRLRNGNSDKNENAFQFGALGTDLTTEGPFSKNSKSSYLINYRYSTLSILKKIGIDVMGDETPHYQDLSFKLNFPTKKAGTFSIWGLGGNSNTESANAIADSTQWNNWDSNKKDYFKTGMGAGGVTHFSHIGEKSYIKSILSVSGNYSQDNVLELNNDYILQKIYEDRFENYALRFSSFVNRKFSSRLSSRFGADYSHIGFNMMANERKSGKLESNINEKGNSWYYYVFNQNKYRFNKSITANFGLGYSYMNLGESHSLEPKFAIECSLTPTQSIGFASGIYSRHEELNAYFMSIPLNETNYVYPNKNLKLKKTAHFVLSYNNTIANHLVFKSEIYYQHLYNVPIAVNPNSTFSTISQRWDGWNSDSLKSSGIGRNYGIELTLEKSFSNSYYFMITASLFDSKFRAADMKWYNTQYNSNYAFNILGGKEFYMGSKHNKIFGLNAKAVYAGGQRYTPIDKEATKELERTIVVQKQRFTKQLPHYFRIDVSASFRINRKNTAHIFSLDIQNATNRKNIQSNYYDFYNDEIRYIYNLGMVPVFNYRIEF